MQRQGSEEHRHSKYILSLLLVAIFITYQTTYSKVPVSDAHTWIRAASLLDWQYILIPTHLLPLLLILIIKTALQMFHISVNLLILIPLVNSCATTAIVFLLCRLFRLLSVNFYTALGTAAMFGFCYGSWYFSNGELHHLGILAVLFLFLRLVAYRSKPSASAAAQIGILHALSVLLHQEHSFFLITIIFMMLYRVRDKNKVKYLLIYLASALLLGITSVSAFGFYVNKTLSIPHLFEWFFYIHEKGFSKEGYVLLRWHDWSLLRCVKGFAMAICYGAQVMVDFLRYFEIRKLTSARYFFTLSTFFFLAFTVFWARGLYILTRMKSDVRSIVMGLLIWCASYKLLFNLTYMPESPEYHTSSNIPLFVLLAIGLQSIRSKFLKIAALASMLSGMVVINAFGSIAPWKEFGKMTADFESFASRTFRESDFFISTESCLDVYIDAKWRRLSLKNLLLRQPLSDVMTKLEQQIVIEVAAGHKVYIYNFVPSTYALKSINFYNPGEKVTKEVFEIELSHLQKIYKLEPVFQYWEETGSRHYLFDRSRDTIWRIEFKNDGF